MQTLADRLRSEGEKRASTIEKQTNFLYNRILITINQS